MVEALPIGPDGIHRAAEEMIADHGPEALAKARKRAQTVRSEGFESLAKTWDLICAVIRDVDDPKHRPEAYKRALGSE
jgi:hypothetical protein